MTRWTQLGDDYVAVGMRGIAALCVRIAEARWPDDLRVMCSRDSPTIVAGVGVGSLDELLGWLRPS